MAAQVSIAFKKLPDGELVSFSNTVFQRMSAEVQYITLKTYCDDIQPKTAAFTLAIANAILGGTDRKDAKKDCREILIKQLVIVARQVEILADDIERVMTDAGFDARKTKGDSKPAVTQVDVPTNIKVKNLDKSGSVMLTWEKVANGLNYAIQHKKKEETAWKNGNYNSKGEFVFNELEADTRYEFQVCTLGPDSLKSDWTMPVGIMVS